MNETIILPELLKTLKLPTMKAHFQELANEASHKGWSCTRYLKELCDQELSHRETLRLSRHIAESNLPKGKSLESYDFSAVPSVNKQQILGLARGDVWIDQGDNLLIFGPPGVGKTHLAAGIGSHLIENGYRVLFARAIQLLQNLILSEENHTLAKTLAKLGKYDCIILDDLGYVQKNKTESRVLFELIAERYESRSLLITCNQPFEEWEEIFGDKKMTLCAVDRLVHHATILSLSKEESYRKKQALNKKEKNH